MTSFVGMCSICFLLISCRNQQSPIVTAGMSGFTEQNTSGKKIWTGWGKNDSGIQVKAEVVLYNYDKHLFSNDVNNLLDPSLSYQVSIVLSIHNNSEDSISLFLGRWGIYLASNNGDITSSEGDYYARKMGGAPAYNRLRLSTNGKERVNNNL